MKTKEEWVSTIVAQQSIARAGTDKVIEQIQLDAFRAGMMYAAKYCKDTGVVPGDNINPETMAYILNKEAQQLQQIPQECYDN